MCHGLSIAADVEKGMQVSRRGHDQAETASIGSGAPFLGPCRLLGRAHRSAQWTAGTDYRALCRRGGSLDPIPGVNKRTAEALIAELEVDMTVFPQR
jgi:hypothetical protein